MLVSLGKKYIRSVKGLRVYVEALWNDDILGDPVMTVFHQLPPPDGSVPLRAGMGIYSEDILFDRIVRRLNRRPIAEWDLIQDDACYDAELLE